MNHRKNAKNAGNAPSQNLTHTHVYNKVDNEEPDCAPFNGKPVAIMGAGGGMGTSRAQYHLRQVCVYLNLRPVNKPEVFSNAFSASFNESGDLIDPSLQQQVTALMNALLAWHSQLTK